MEREEEGEGEGGVTSEESIYSLLDDIRRENY